MPITQLHIDVIVLLNVSIFGDVSSLLAKSAVSHKKAQKNHQKNPHISCMSNNLHSAVFFKSTNHQPTNHRPTDHWPTNPSFLKDFIMERLSFYRTFGQPRKLFRFVNHRLNNIWWIIFAFITLNVCKRKRVCS